jgi:ATP-binding cassette subfamily G (WHITE) protein 2 (PDR)
MAMTDCRYCPVDQTNQLLRQLALGTGEPWRNVGLMVVYVVFNILAVYGIYWLVRLPKARRDR